jgi:hypothetical protein
MSKFLRVVFVSLFFANFFGSFFGSRLLATTHYGKTFLATRPAGTNKAMEMTGWYAHPYANHDAGIKGHVAATAFYQRSDNDANLGKYFGINGSNAFRIGFRTDDPSTDIDGQFLIHRGRSGVLQSGDNVKGTVSLKPDLEAFGLRLDYFQDINSPFEGLFFKASLPIVSISSNMNIKVDNESKITIGGKEWSLYDFFSGNVNVSAKAQAQKPLTHGKIGGKQSVRGPADLDLAVGYKFANDKKKYLHASFGVVVPTGNKVTGQYLFEPVYGNGHHLGMSVGLDTGISLWEGERGKSMCNASVNYKYLFTGTEARLLGLKAYKLGSYRSVGTQGAPFMFPAANVLTQDLSVKPGSQADALLAFSFQSKRFVVDFGYNSFLKDEESVSLKNWTDNVYGLVDRKLLFMNTPLTPLTHHPEIVAGDLTTINLSDLDLSVVKSPVQITHKIFGGLSYKFDVYNEYPATFNVGASYEFATDNAAVEQYALWMKAGMSF